MRTLVYKRTHNGDPDERGTFGVNDCMGSVRGWEFEAVIGVGGTGDEPREHGIAEKINWIGIGPHKTPGSPRGPLVTFDHYVYFGETGPALADQAPNLARHIYDMNVRTLMNFTPAEQGEVDAILALAHDEPPSPALSNSAAGAEAQCRVSATTVRRKREPCSC